MPAVIIYGESGVILIFLVLGPEPNFATLNRPVDWVDSLIALSDTKVTFLFDGTHTL
jgi:hypothetical protein